MLGTLIRAGDVLDLFTLEEPEWGATATAQRLGIGKSLAHESLATLTEIGLLQRVGHGRYRLGWRNMSLAAVLLRSNALSAHSRPVVRDLVESRGMSVSLVAWDRGRVILINRQGRCASRAPAAGAVLPVDDSAAARVLMASRPDAELRLVWGAGGVRTRHLTLEALAADLDEVRRLGWAEDRTPAASVSVAAPVHGVDGDVTAALSLAPGFVTACNDVCNHAKLAVAAASRISEAMRGAAVAV